MNAPKALTALAVLVLAGLAVWFGGAGKPERPADRPTAVQPAPVVPPRETPEARRPAAPQSERRLPFSDPEVLREVNRTLDLIARGGPFPHRQDGVVFQNREGRLPKGDYREYTVETPGSRDRGARRIVVDRRTGRKYYSGDHYRTFTLIDPPGAEGQGGGGRP
jgi:ribonuclease T1